MSAAPVVKGSIWRQLPLLIWLVVLWLLLWDQVSVLSVVTGIVLALLVTRVFYLPPVELPDRVGPLGLVVFIARFVYDLVRASFEVAFIAVDPRRVPTSSIVAVQLSTKSDLSLTLTALAISLVPGSLVVEADRQDDILYLHVLGTETPDDVERARADVIRVEERIVRAIGSRDDVRRVNASRAARSLPPIVSGRRQQAWEARHPEVPLEEYTPSGAYPDSTDGSTQS
ncbi:Na+/H+ antiporter subunit E [Agreia sp. COWG]|uniref:Na+/H+ antiporter subunit E n=1 Tax=Agreia sp. COWG TaxID=2773266 RepID=UPI001928FA06|nr:Na+/H+ antiporter subunit E [Agreia sp. COWG]CAD6007290.1 Cation:proton antiporter [Agreia sp. COWG]